MWSLSWETPGLTTGLTLEGINNLGTLKKKVIVILNDNKMSISPNVGAFAGYLNRIVHGQAYNRLREEVEKMIRAVPRLGPRLLKLSQDLVETAKSMLIPGLVFEELGFEYVGPINGHNLEELMDVLSKAKKRPGPVMIHIVTQKGKGYGHAEQLPVKYHGVTPFDFSTGAFLQGAGGGAKLHFGVRQGHLPDRGKGFARGGHYRRHGRRHGPGRILQTFSRALLRRGNCRAARRHLRHGTGLRRHAAGGGDLFHLFAARL